MPLYYVVWIVECDICCDVLLLVIWSGWCGGSKGVVLRDIIT